VIRLAGALAVRAGVAVSTVLAVQFVAHVLRWPDYERGLVSGILCMFALSLVPDRKGP